MAVKFNKTEQLKDKLKQARKHGLRLPFIGIAQALMVWVIGTLYAEYRWIAMVGLVVMVLLIIEMMRNVRKLDRATEDK